MPTSSASGTHSSTGKRHATLHAWALHACTSCSHPGTCHRWLRHSQASLAGRMPLWASPARGPSSCATLRAAPGGSLTTALQCLLPRLACILAASGSQVHLLAVVYACWHTTRQVTSTAGAGRPPSTCLPTGTFDESWDALGDLFDLQLQNSTLEGMSPPAAAEGCWLQLQLLPVPLVSGMSGKPRCVTCAHCCPCSIAIWMVKAICHACRRFAC